MLLPNTADLVVGSHDLAESSWSCFSLSWLNWSYVCTAALQFSIYKGKCEADRDHFVLYKSSGLQTDPQTECTQTSYSGGLSMSCLGVQVSSCLNSFDLFTWTQKKFLVMVLSTETGWKKHIDIDHGMWNSCRHFVFGCLCEEYVVVHSVEILS